MAKKEKRMYSKTDILMLEQAGVVHALLYGTDGSDGKLADFTTDFPELNAAWLAAFKAAIDSADEVPGDREVLIDQRVDTQSVNQLMDLARKRMTRLYRYAGIAYADKHKPRDIFAYALFIVGRYSQSKLHEAMLVAHEQAKTEPHKTKLTAAGFSQSRIDELFTLAQSLSATNLEQEIKKTDRVGITQERIKKCNTVWKLWKKLNMAAKVIYASDFASRKQFTLYPENAGKTATDNGDTTKT